MSGEIRLEGFSSPLKGQRLWICGSPKTVGYITASRLSVLEEELLGRGRSILLQYNTRDISMRWSQKIKWDAIFRIRDTHDLRIAAQYIQTATKPTRIVWVGDEPPAAFLSVLNDPEITVFCVSTVNPKLAVWNAIFWDIVSVEQKIMEEALLHRMGLPALTSLNLPVLLKELRTFELGLVWTSIGESNKAGAVYWVDYNDGKNSSETIQPSEAIEYLRDVLTMLEKRD